MKTCTKCGESKPLDQFLKDARRKGGLQSNCRTCHGAASAAWNRRHPKKLAQAGARYRVVHSAKRRRSTREWQKVNPGRVNAHTNARLAAKLRRTPPWLTQAQRAEIEGLYHFAKVMEQITGRKYHVDHIEPLRGQDVSGLHVPWNLQVIPARDNISKGNRRIVKHG